MRFCPTILVALLGVVPGCFYISDENAAERLGELGGDDGGGGDLDDVG